MLSSVLSSERADKATNKRGVHKLEDAICDLQRAKDERNDKLIIQTIFNHNPNETINTNRTDNE